MLACNSSTLRLDVIGCLLHGSYEKIYGYPIDRIAWRNRALNDVRERLTKYEKLIRSGGLLTKEESDYIDAVLYQVCHFNRTGELATYWVKKDDVYEERLRGGVWVA